MLIIYTSKAQTMVGNPGKNCTLLVKNFTKVGTTLTTEKKVLISPLTTLTDSMEQQEVLVEFLNLNYTELKQLLVNYLLILALLNSTSVVIFKTHC